MTTIAMKRHESLQKMHLSKDSSDLAESIIDYYAEGGSIDNVVSFLEGKELSQKSFCDYVDKISFCAKTTLQICNIFENQEERSILIECEHPKKEDIQRFCNQIEMPAKVVFNEARDKAQIKMFFNGKSPGEVKSLREDVEKLIPENSFSKKYIENIQEAAKEESAHRLHERFGIDFSVAVNIWEKVNSRKYAARPKCNYCSNFLESVSGEDSYFCHNCDILAEELTERQRKQVECNCCDKCGDVFENNECASCGFSLEETTTAMQVAPHISPSFRKESCPNCKGTLALFGDVWKCLNCMNTVKESVNSPMISFDVYPECQVSLIKNESSDKDKDKNDNNRDDDLSGDEENDVRFEDSGPAYTKAVVLKGKCAPAYNMLTGEGFIYPGMTVYSAADGGWTPFYGEGEADSIMIPCDNDDHAKMLDDKLSAEGYSSEIIDYPDKDEKMAYYPDKRGEGGYMQQGSTYTYDSPLGKQGHAPYHYNPTGPIKSDSVSSVPQKYNLEESKKASSEKNNENLGWLSIGFGG